MKTRSLFMRSRAPALAKTLSIMLSLALVFTGAPAMAQLAQPVQTPAQPQELPIEIETELAFGSLKQAPLWRELVQMLKNPQLVPATGGRVQANIVRRPSFTATPLPPLNVWSLDYLPHTGQPLRLRTSDGEISWDQPGALFDPNQAVPVDANNVPTALRTVIGELVTDANNNLVVRNPAVTAFPNKTNTPSASLPADGTVVAEPVDVSTITALPTPVNEEDFFRPATDTAGVPGPLRPLIGRPAAEILGKALFWDMQVGSDGVQACGSCHFHAGVDNRSKNQRNPNTTGPEGNAANLEALAVSQTTLSNTAVVAGDFPFQRGPQDDATIGGANGNSNDVLSSMGVRFRTFTDIPTPGGGRGSPAFIQVPGNVKPLAPDIGIANPDPVPVFQDLRRVEPRNTPTMHSAAFNFDNFWDGRARFHFNGGSVFGASDPTAHIFINQTGTRAGGILRGATNGMIKGDPTVLGADQPVRIKFSSLASQAVGPPLSNFEMSFDGRNWAKIGKKLLQVGVTPLANQLVSPTDSVLGPFSNGATPGISLTYEQLIQLAFRRDLWNNNNQHLNGAPSTDPFDGYSLTVANGGAQAANTNQFRQIEANFSLFFGLAVQAYETLLIPDDTPFDRFLDANPNAANGLGQPGEQMVLFPTLIRELVTGSASGNLVFPDPTLFGPDELFGLDIFAGANLTAVLPVGSPRNPDGYGSNPFTRTARCMQCHLGPEQTDHNINFSHGLLKGNPEFEFPSPPQTGTSFTQPLVLGAIPVPIASPEPTGPFSVVAGLVLAEEVGEVAQDAVEVEPRNMFAVGGTEVQRIVAAPGFFAFGDQGIYNIGVRPTVEDLGRGGNDPFGWPLSNAVLALKNIAGQDFAPPDAPGDPENLVPNFDPELPGGGLFEFTGADQRINPGLTMEPTTAWMPVYMAPWISNLSAGELHPQIDELSFSPNTISFPNGGPALEFGENLFGSDVHCALYDPAAFGAGPPNFGWGPECPNAQSGVPNNIGLDANPYVPGSLVAPLQGTWPMANRVNRKGAFKAPQLRNVELTGPYWHTGSYSTLRQVVDFYTEGGDFPLTNAEFRDQHLVSLTEQVFSFGRSTGADLLPFADALPDPTSQYNAMPDTRLVNADNTSRTQEPGTSTPEQAKVALVKFLISLTDQRVKFERAPFDRPEIFVPIDGTAPDNAGGRAALVTNSVVFDTPTPPAGTTALFRQIPPVGAAGNATPLQPFLGVDHFAPAPAAASALGAAPARSAPGRDRRAPSAVRGLRAQIR